MRNRSGQGNPVSQSNSDGAITSLMPGGMNRRLLRDIASFKSSNDVGSKIIKSKGYSYKQGGRPSNRSPKLDVMTKPMSTKPKYQY